MNSWLRAVAIVWICVASLGTRGLAHNDTVQGSLAPGTAEPQLESIRSRFQLRSADEPEGPGCQLVPGQPESLTQCRFQPSAKTFLIIHGWTLSGMFEGWISKMVSALHARESAANIVVLDWLDRAHQHYPVAAANTRIVGRDVAIFLEWLEEASNHPLENVHLIGYSLGAHAAGFAGEHMRNPARLGRITGLDPAGPTFEGRESAERLSPEDAGFVDVLHTHTRGSPGLSIGIKQPVGHLDVYPNGGSNQPGCDIRDVFGGLASNGLLSFTDAFKCEHERAVHLFIDSLLHTEQMPTAFRCTDSDRFNRGLCLSCRKHRCSAVGYGAERVRARRSTRMFHKTRGGMPFKVFHYQVKIHFTSQVHIEQLRPRLSVSLLGTTGEAHNLKIVSKDSMEPNTTHSFLVYTEQDVGDLLQVKFKWERSDNWYQSVWYKMRTWSGLDHSGSGLSIRVRKIRVKCGETQKKMAFCSKDQDTVDLKPSQEEVFVKCPDGWISKRSFGSVGKRDE